MSSLEFANLPRDTAPDAPSGPRILKDAHGNILADGDCVIPIKDLKPGVAFVLKGGSKSKPIRLMDGDDEIDRNATALKACFVKNA